MSHLKITDNQNSVDISKVLTYIDAPFEVDKGNLIKLANVTIRNSKADSNSNLLMFPRDLGECEYSISDKSILSISETSNTISTGNIMGFVGINETQVSICSRFARTDSEDYFLHYMLQKVFAINLFDLKHSSSTDPVFDYLLLLFPYFLKRALAQGVYKKYQTHKYNDANIKGPVDIPQHIKKNIPFRGTVAYTCREQSFDNEITQLIRHTIEYIQTKSLGNVILCNDIDTKDAVSQIMQATQTYSKNDRSNIIKLNQKPVKHPYYSEYAPLQSICLKILRHQGIKYGDQKDKVYGILFDGAWLWEAYLYRILEPHGFNHPKNITSEGGIRMFCSGDDCKQIDKNSRKLYPDFYKENYVADAKYKRLNNGVSREDLYQVVTYMHCLKAAFGLFIYPIDKQERDMHYNLSGFGGQISVMPVYIPQEFSDFKDFQKLLQDQEYLLINRYDSKGQTPVDKSATHLCPNPPQHFNYQTLKTP